VGLAQKEILLKGASPKTVQWIEACEALSSPSSSRDEEVPLYETRGAHLEKTGTVFSVFAPHAKSIDLVLTAFGTEEHRISMKKNIDGTWQAETEHAPPGRTYRYEVEDFHGVRRYRIDPFSFTTLIGHGKIESVVTDLNQYQWNDALWMEKRSATDPLKSPLSIYEMHLESWKKEGGRTLNYREIAPDLVAYCKKMQFTHVEIYGILDNSGGWGYQVNNFFAPNHRMGNADDFKFFVDCLHKNGIGVIIDWIPAHYNANYSETSMHCFDGTDHLSGGHSPWGTQYIDFGKEEARKLMKSNAIYWLKEFHVDGLRVDAVSPIIKRGKEIPSGVSFLQEVNQEVHRLFPGVLTIAEETDGFPKVTKPVESGGLGFDLKWWTPWSFASRYFIQTPLKERRCDEHFKDKITHHLHDVKWGEKVLLVHSHDDSANPHGELVKPEHLDKTLYKLDVCEKMTLKFADLRNFFAWQVFSPSRGHLIHMGDEIGQRRSPNALLGELDGAVEWHLLTSNDRHRILHIGLQDYISDLNRLYLEKSVLWKNGEDGLKICCEHQLNSVVAYQKSCIGEPSLIIVHNFSSGNWKKYNIPIPPNVKDLREIFNSDSVKYGGGGAHLNPEVEIVRNLSGKATHMTIALPPMSSLVFEECSA